MREHPIPQDITNYRFHIIGSMTLRQFGEVALGCIIALILYKTNLLAIIKWPLIGISVGLGIAAAFLPIEERPLDHWIVTFIKVLYKPTQFFWKRSPQVPKAFSYTPTVLQPIEEEYDLSPARRQRIKEYLTSVSKPEQDKFGLSLEEQNRVSSILTTFTSQPVIAAATQPSSASVPAEKPDLEVRVRKLRPVHTNETVVYAQPANPAQSVSPLTESMPTQHELTATSPTAVAVEMQAYSHGSSVPQSYTPSLVTPIVAPSVPPAQPGIVTLQPSETLTTTDASTSPVIEQTPVYLEQPPLALETQPQPTQSAEFNADLPFPSTPTEANKVVGMVLTPQADLLSDAIVEIQTTDGIVARAVKTNALGQFFITTPLSNGEYTLVVEKEGFAFNPVRLQLSGQIVQPIEVRSA